MLQMRPATAEDAGAVAAMVRRRAAWMQERGLRTSSDIAETLASQAGDPDWPVWVLHDEDGALLGCTTVLEESPQWCFTEAERAEPALFLASTWTLPSDGRRYGRLIARWALDRAAHQELRHVRRGCFHERLAAYYTEVQGWELLRTLQRRGRTAYILTRPAEPQPDLPVKTAA
ncbi:hypothetical protein J0910_01100 [Nocardiopsis sp. CNT-189]